MLSGNLYVWMMWGGRDKVVESDDIGWMKLQLLQTEDINYSVTIENLIDVMKLLWIQNLGKLWPFIALHCKVG